MQRLPLKKEAEDFPAPISNIEKVLRGCCCRLNCEAMTADIAARYEAATIHEQNLCSTFPFGLVNQRGCFIIKHPHLLIAFP